MSYSPLSTISFSSTTLMRRPRLLAKLAAVVLFAGVCAVNPASAAPGSLALMSESKEKKIGAEEHAKVLASMPMVEDEELLAYVRRVGNKVAAASDRPDLGYEFHIIDSPAINAFALPGGYVYVNRGLLTFMNSEADLAAVLGHEIGHITARHGVKRQSRGTLARTAAAVGGFVAAVATNSNYVGSQINEVASIWAQTGLSGYGREQELEADRLGAEFIAKAGYDPNAVINVVTVLKNQEDFNRKIGNSDRSYHGLFATHPRNDKRLQEAIGSVADISENEITEIDNSDFRENLEGLIVGESAASRNSDTRNRYYQTLLGYTMVFPDEWTIDETMTTVTANAPGIGSLRVGTQRLQQNIEPRVFLRDSLGIEDLQKSEALQQFRLLGHTGMTTSDSGKIERVAAIYLGPRVFVFRGEIDDVSKLSEVDEALLSSIRSFRAIQRGEAVSGTEPKIKFVRATEHFDFSVIAQTSPIANYPEETLRLLNNYYPRGNPDAGEWVKLIE